MLSGHRQSECYSGIERDPPAVRKKTRESKPHAPRSRVVAEVSQARSPNLLRAGSPACCSPETFVRSVWWWAYGNKSCGKAPVVIFLGVAEVRPEVHAEQSGGGHPLMRAPRNNTTMGPSNPACAAEFTY